MFSFLFAPASPTILEIGLFIIRVGVGVVTIGHGIPQLMGGPATWTNIGKNAGLVGIHFLPIMWGFLAACTHTFGGLALTLGCGTRIVCVPLTFMMVVACLFHWNNGDSFNVSSFALTLLFVYFGFIFIGSGKFSLDYYLYRKNVKAQEYHPLMNRPEDYL